MNRNAIRRLLREVKTGGVTVDDALERLRHLPLENLGFATLDHHRALRRGYPEVVYGQGKTAEQVVEIVSSLKEMGQTVLVTRVGADVHAAVRARHPAAVFHAGPRPVVVPPGRPPRPRPGILVLSAGTSDLPVAEDAAVTAEVLGNRVERAYDVGVAGLHRLLARKVALARARVIVAVAGMEGALPSVVAGLTDCPVIAVPTSTGYGAGAGGQAALLAMLNSCAGGIGVVNIDNGFGAGLLASMINRQSAKRRVTRS